MLGFPRRRRRLSIITSLALVVLIWVVGLRLAGKSPRATLVGPKFPIQVIQFSQDGKTLASQNTDGSVRLWDPVSKRLLATLPESEKPDWFHFRQSISQDGSISAKLVRTNGDWHSTQITIVDARTGHEILYLSPHPDQVNTIAVSPDGKVFATGGGFTEHPWPVNAAGDVRLWDTKTGQRIVTLNRQWGAISSVAFSPDGSTLATACYDGTIMLWNVPDILGQ